MKIREVVISTTDLGAAADFYRNVLELPVVVGSDHVTVEIGRSRLVSTRGENFAGAHHLAFGISPDDFELARKWLGRQVELIAANGSDVIEGPPGWDSRSVYFRGPDGIVLELIAREADAGVPASSGEVPRMLSISEVGIGVPDVQQAVGELAEAYGLDAFTPRLPAFTPVGDHDGLIILVDRERIWFPTDADLPARASVAVRIDAPKGGGTLALSEAARIDG
ncbi:VOC family protein [Nocardia sp. NPDC051756]|uniref:VOC family protein n=1 Tax=Nocardia sp. NPDC051756 TaxID=3154751 RepID=UPI0034384235